MKLRFTSDAYKGFTGNIGVVEFKDGLSVDDVHPNEGRRLAGVFGAEWEDGSAANVNDGYDQMLHTPAPSQEQIEADREALSETQVVKAGGKTYTEAELAEIADKGIDGLRVIADPLGVKGKSIKALIDGVLAVAGAKAE
jgi:hypothetical protein